MLRKKQIAEVALFYAAHFFRYLGPLVLTPFLARQLGPERYGIVLAALAIAALIALFVEFGFGVSATRDLAGMAPEDQGRAISAIMGAKLILFVPGVLVGVTLCLMTTALNVEPWLRVLVVLLGLVQGTNITWYFRARDRMILGVCLDLSAHVVTFTLLLSLVRGPDDAILIPLAYLVSIGSVQLIAMILIARDVSLQMPSLSGSLSVLRGGHQIFIQNICWASYGIGSPVLLAWVSTAEQVGFYGPADKLITAALQLVTPFTALMLPRITRRLLEDRDAALAVIKRTITFLSMLALAAAGLNAFLAPYLIEIVFGPGFQETGLILIILGFILPISVFGHSLNMLLLLPLRLDALVTKTMLVAALANVAAMAVLAPSFGAVGVAFGRVFAECFAVLLTLVMTLRSGVLRVEPSKSLRVPNEAAQTVRP
jgi:O-antigen/teichoic acid export membrane protein